MAVKLLIKLRRVSKNLQQNNSKTVATETVIEIPKEIPKEIYISRRKKENYWWFEINILVEYQKIIKSTN